MLLRQRRVQRALPRLVHEVPHRLDAELEELLEHVFPPALREEVERAPADGVGVLEVRLDLGQIYRRNRPRRVGGVR